MKQTKNKNKAKKKKKRRLKRTEKKKKELLHDPHYILLVIGLYQNILYMYIKGQSNTEHE